jgi:hypothetical protein
VVRERHPGAAANRGVGKNAVTSRKRAGGSAWEDRRSWIELDELISERGATRLGFALLLKFYVQHGRFPRGRAELPYVAVRFVADQVKVEAPELGLYEWSGRTVEFHRAQIRAIWASASARLRMPRS